MPASFFRVFLAHGLPLFFSTATACVAAEVRLNPDSATFDSEGQGLHAANGALWTAWKTYSKSRETAVARLIDFSRSDPLGARQVLTDSPGILHGLRLVPAPDGFTALWAEKSAAHWRIMARHQIPQLQQSTQPVSLPGTDAINPVGLRLNNGHLVVAWQTLPGQGQSRIHGRVLVDGTWSDAILDVTAGGHPTFRPQLAEGPDGVWVFWDEYHRTEREYRVMGRRWLPNPGPVERISPPGQAGDRCLTPVALGTPSRGVRVAWVRLRDVQGGDGVIDMIHTLEMAVRTREGWRMARTKNGSAEAAVLLSGLLPDLRPGKGYPSGYLGNRRKPMLLGGGDSTWLLWERKSAPSGGGTHTPGQLLGRPCRDGVWGETLLLHQGWIDYELVQPARLVEGAFWLTGADIPRDWNRPLQLARVPLADAQPFNEEDWRDQYRPVPLPFPDEPARNTIEVEGKTFQLYWADLHCHSGLTGDAEGEPDEILHYARDRARLDVMVLQDNDDVHGDWLTEGEYYQGVLHSQRFSESGRFLALPGYEWTQRKAKAGVAFNPRKSVYTQPLRGTYPNHRTVIYPPEGGPIIRYPEVAGDFEALTREVEKRGGLLDSQHRTFDITGSPAEANMEVTSCWGIYLRDVPGQFHGWLDRGKRLGFVGCSDSHRRNPGLCGGLTGIWAESLDAADILDALKRHRCFASNGSKILVDARANGWMSDTVVTAKGGTVNLTLHVVGTRPVTCATLVTDQGRKVRTWKGDGGLEWNLEHTATGLSLGQHWYYWEIEQEGSSRQYTGNTAIARGNLAWSSPIFVVVE